ncbi:MFS transporter [Brucella sp. MAB-22]|uniref:MFS transporter n=1 Tax=Brucella TaxID=234 RepID=UPI000F661C4E|nr:MULTISPECIES: MFS transporter [Brucella]RRY18971.1 MFS transporter [Brucella anthropi]UYT54016.1 MFS transporter [Brucella sp. MAB-22]
MQWESLSDFDQTRIKRWQWGMLALALLCEMFLAADWYAFAAVIPFISETLQLDSAQAGLAQGIFALTYGLGMIVWSQLSRRMNARSLLLIGLFCTAIGMVAQVYVQTYAQLIALRLFIGFFDAAIFLGNMKLIIGWFPQKRRGSMIGLILAAYSLAITLDFAIGIPLSITYGWRTFFAILAIGTLATAAAVLLFTRNNPAHIGYKDFRWEPEKQQTSTASLASIFRSKWIIVGSLGISACTMAIAGTATWVIPGYIAVHQMPVEDAALIGTLMGLSQVVFLVIGGYAADRLNKTGMIKFGTVLAVLVAAMFTVGMAIPLGFGWLILMALLSGMALFGGGAIFAFLSEKYPEELATAAVGYAEIFAILATFISPWVMGVVIKVSGGSFVSAFLTFAIMEAIILVIVLVVTRESFSLNDDKVAIATSGNGISGEASRP